MTIAQLKDLLSEHPSKTLRFVLPTGSAIPPHAHVTEVARIDKRFIDCGGTKRTDSVCQLQTWFDDDTEHRLIAAKLLAILEKSTTIVGDDSLNVEIEHEAPFISQFPIASAEVAGDSLLFALAIKHTDCLAKELCVPPAQTRAINFKELPSLQETACCAGGCA